MKKILQFKVLGCFRNVLLFLLLSTTSVWAEEAYSQEIHLSQKSTTIESIFAQISKQCKLEFFYNSDVLNVKKVVTLTSNKGTLEQILSQVLGDKYSYSVKDNYVMIFQKQQPQSQSKSNSKPQTINGRVVDSKGVVIAGVSVAVKGTSIGTSTASDGTFTVKVQDPQSATLVFTFVGMKKKEVKYTGAKTMTIILEDDLTMVDEVIVTGYQEIKKERMTGAVESISAKDIVNKGYTTIEDVLKGSLTGVATMNLSGRPGAQAQIRIRGINSLTGSTDPMWIVDGMPLQGDVPQISMGGNELQETVLTSGIGNISPDDIESITVLKDAAATAIYGSRAANGVIVVKTKRGSVGKSYINASVSYAVSEAPSNRLVMMNTQEKIAFERGIYEDFPGSNIGGRVFQLLKKVDQGKISRAAAEAEIARLGQINTNWFDEIFRVAQTQNYNATLSGGNETTQYYANVSYLDQQGIQLNNDYKNFGANLKLTPDFNSRLRINFDVMSSYRADQTSGSVVNPLDYATYANPYERPYDQNGNYEYDRSSYPALSTIKDGYQYDFNIIEDMLNNTNRSKYISNQINLKLELKLIEGMMFSSMGTISNSATHATKEYLPGTFSSKYSSWLGNYYSEGEIPDDMNLGKLSETTSRSFSWTIRNQLEYARGFDNGNHYVNVYLGQEVSSRKGTGFASMLPEWSNVYGVGSYPNLVGLEISNRLDLSALGSHNENQDRSVSFFATGSYSFKDRYVVQGSMRFDGVDIIGTSNRFAPLWNVSGKWNLHNEAFMEDIKWVNQLSVRASYGFTGSIDRNVSAFSKMRKVSNYKYDGEDIFDRYDPANPSVKWQRKEDRNLGLDISAFNNRINLSANYYCNDTRNLIDTKKTAMSSGLSSITANVASLRNSGWELSLKTMNIRTDNFSWTTSFNITQNKGRVTETYYKELKDYSVGINSTFEESYNMYIQGQPIKAYYGYRFAGVDPLTGGTLAYIDGYDNNGNRLGAPYGNGKYVYNMDEEGNYSSQLLHAARTYLGESYPPVTGGFSTQFNYKRFSLSASFTFMTGFLARSFQTYNNGVSGAARNVLQIEANRWRKPGDQTLIPKYETSRTEYLYQVFDFRFEKGNFLKCNNISFGYNVEPTLCNLLHISRARINFNVSNVFTLTKFRGIDPETMGAFTYPSARKYNVSLSIGI